MTDNSQPLMIYIYIYNVLFYNNLRIAEWDLFLLLFLSPEFITECQLSVSLPRTLMLLTHSPASIAAFALISSDVTRAWW